MGNARRCANHELTYLEEGVVSYNNPGEHLIDIYDAGRDFAHRMTFRRWD